MPSSICAGMMTLGQTNDPRQLPRAENEDTAAGLLAFVVEGNDERGDQASSCRAITRRLNVTIEPHT